VIKRCRCWGLTKSRKKQIMVRLGCVDVRKCLLPSKQRWRIINIGVNDSVVIFFGFSADRMDIVKSIIRFVDKAGPA
ncbi:hypothetical protein THOM_1272, partial [Trachipleistophora hominis]